MILYINQVCHNSGINKRGQTMLTLAYEGRCLQLLKKLIATIDKKRDDTFFVTVITTLFLKEIGGQLY